MVEHRTCPRHGETPRDHGAVLIACRCSGNHLVLNDVHLAQSSARRHCWDRMPNLDYGQLAAMRRASASGKVLASAAGGDDPAA